MGTILNETVSADAYTEIIRPSSDKMITGTYQYNQGSGNLVAALTLQCCDDRDPTNLSSTDIGWVDEGTHTFDPVPGGSAGKGEFSFADADHSAYRIMVDVTSGSGPVKIEHKV